MGRWGLFLSCVFLAPSLEAMKAGFVPSGGEPTSRGAGAAAQPAAAKPSFLLEKKKFDYKTCEKSVLLSKAENPQAFEALTKGHPAEGPLAILWERATSGRRRAHYTLGKILWIGELFGLIPDKTRKLGLSYLKDAAEAGQPDALNFLFRQRSKMFAEGDVLKNLILWGNQGHRLSQLKADELFGLPHADAQRALQHNAAWVLFRSPCTTEYHTEKAAQLNLPEACFEMGAKLRTTSPKKAHRYFLKAARRGETLSMRNLTKKFLQEGDFLRGLKWANRAAEQNHPVGLYDVGVYFYRLQRMTEAQDFFQQAREVEKRFAEAGKGASPIQETIVSSIAKCYQCAAYACTRTHPDEALKLLEEAFKRGIDKKLVSFELGVCYNAAGNKEEARRFFEMAARSNHLEAQYNLLVMGNLSPEEKILPLKELAQKGSQEAAFALVHLLTTNCEKDTTSNYAEIRKLCEPWVSIDPDMSFSMGVLALKSEEFLDALHFFKMPAEKEGYVDQYKAQTNYAGTLHKVGRFEEAILWAKHVIEQNNNPYAHHVLHKILGDQEKHDEAFEHAIKAAQSRETQFMFNAFIASMNCQTHESMSIGLYWLGQAAEAGDAGAIQILQYATHLFSTAEGKPGEPEHDDSEFSALALEEAQILTSIEQRKQIPPQVAEKTAVLKESLVPESCSPAPLAAMTPETPLAVKVPSLNIKGKRAELRKAAIQMAAIQNLNQTDVSETPMAPKTRDLCAQLFDSSQTFEDQNFLALFSDPFFKGRVDIKKTKSGWCVVARFPEGVVTTGGHRNHSRFYDGIDVRFRRDLQEILDKFGFSTAQGG